MNCSTLADGGARRSSLRRTSSSATLNQSGPRVGSAGSITVWDKSDRVPCTQILEQLPAALLTPRTKSW